MGEHCQKEAGGRRSRSLEAPGLFPTGALPAGCAMIWGKAATLLCLPVTWNEESQVLNILALNTLLQLLPEQENV